MSTSPNQSCLNQMAEDIFGLTVMAWQHRLATRHAAGEEVSETQYLTLDMLAKRSPQTVGELQRGINVLPAQMSRIIRSLETSFEKPLIRCELNPTDRRKIDVYLTSDGQKAYHDFRQVRLSKTMELLQFMDPRDREEFVRICGQIKTLYRQSQTPAASDEWPPL